MFASSFSHSSKQAIGQCLIVMKKLCAIAFTVTLLCIMFAACKSPEEQVDSSHPKEFISDSDSSSHSEVSASNVENEDSETYSEVSASDIENEDSETLWIVTNVGFENEQFGGEEDLRHVIEYFGGLPSGIDVNLEVLPMEGADLHSRLTRIRTEIMAGEGPDVFLMMQPLTPDREMLFPIPQATMERHVFLPLDELRDSSEHIEWDKINPQILSAGQGSEGQMLLPMYYSLDMGVSGEAVDLPATWENAISGNTPVLSQAYGSAFHFGRFRNLAFTDVANYEKEAMTITEEKLGQRMKEACSVPFDRENDMARWSGDGTDIQEEEGTAFPLHNTQGGVTAQISGWLAVNINTDHKKDALALVDMMMSRKFLSMESFWDEGRAAMGTDIYLFPQIRWYGGIPVYDDFFDNGQTLVYIRGFSEEQLSLHHRTIQEISYVYIPTSIDMELWALFNDCQAAEDEVEIDKLVSKCYSTMQMMLAES